MTASLQPLRVLVVEDNPSDAEILLHTLRLVGFDPIGKIVCTAPDFRDALVPDLDIILSDYTMPQFSGPAALKILKEQGYDIPFIVLSGTVGEDSAVAVMREGATDYLLKDRLTRLGPAVQRALDLRALLRRNRSSESKVRTLVRAVEQSADSIVITDHRGVIEYVNPAFLRTTGYSMDEVIGKTPSILKSGGHDDAFYRRLWNTISSGAIFRAEFSNRKKNGDLYSEYQRISPVLDDNGAIVNYVSTGVDLTEQRRVESALRESEWKYRSIFESVPDAIFMITAAGTLASINPAFERITGWKVDEWKDRNFIELLHEGDRAKAMENFQRMLEGFENPVMEYRVSAASGGYVTVEVLTVPQKTAEGIVGVIGIARDVTERNVLEQQFRQAQKMESIGTLAGGIAHDFNNILGIILASASHAERVSADGPQLHANLDIIQRTVQRGAALVRQILTFARKNDPLSTEVDVNELISELTAMLAPTFPKTIEIHLELSSDIPRIAADAGQVHQALMNLCVNARDAIQDAGGPVSPSGVIAIRTRYEDTPAAVVVQISDTGKGMDDVTRQRIFDPFFTTKEKGKGTGLGLAVVYGVMQNVKGSIAVDSVPGRGTTFTLRFPAGILRSGTADEPVQANRETPDGHETVLIIEDEPSLLQLATIVFESKGYTVLQATTGPDGVQTFLDHAETIDLVLTDFGLPGLDGYSVLRKIKERRPDMKVILASGFLEPQQRLQVLDLGVREIIQKPYEYHEILVKVRQVLDA